MYIDVVHKKERTMDADDFDLYIADEAILYEDWREHDDAIVRIGARAGWRFAFWFVLSFALILTLLCYASP